MIVIYAKKNVRPHIKEIVTSQIRLGKAGLGNKGACCIRMRYKDSTLSFAVAHLESGRHAGHDAIRRGQLEYVIKNTYTNDKSDIHW